MQFTLTHAQPTAQLIAQQSDCLVVAVYENQQ